MKLRKAESIEELLIFIINNKYVYHNTPEKGSEIKTLFTENLPTSLYGFIMTNDRIVRKETFDLFDINLDLYLIKDGE